MIKRIICIECPKGCNLSVEVEKMKVIVTSGNECPKGEEYAVSEVENPLRTLTSTVIAEELSLKMIPVRTDRPIPKDRVLEAVEYIRKITIKRPVNIGDIVVKDLLGLGADLIATRGSL